MKAYRPAPMSVSLAAMSGIILALGIIGLASVPLLISGASRSTEEWPAVLLFSVIVVWIAILISWQARPSCYEIRDDSVAILRAWPFKDVTIPLANIREARRAKIRMVWIWKVYGISGLFSDTGWFKNREFGKFFASVTDGDKVVMLSNGRKYAISPAQPDEFTADVQRIIAQV